MFKLYQNKNVEIVDQAEHDKDSRVNFSIFQWDCLQIEMMVWCKNFLTKYLFHDDKG